MRWITHTRCCRSRGRDTALLPPHTRRLCLRLSTHLHIHKSSPELPRSTLPSFFPCLYCFALHFFQGRLITLEVSPITNAFCSSHKHRSTKSARAGAAEQCLLRGEDAILTQFAVKAEMYHCSKWERNSTAICQQQPQTEDAHLSSGIGAREENAC